MTWTVEKSAKRGLVWVEDENGETICDLYSRSDSLDWCEPYTDAEKNAQMIANLPELVLTLERISDQSEDSWARNQAFVALARMNKQE